MELGRLTKHGCLRRWRSRSCRRAPPAAGKKGAKTGTIEIIESKDGKFRFSIRDAEGKYLAGSAVGHATEKETKEIVEELKKVLVTATYTHKKTTEAKKDKGS